MRLLFLSPYGIIPWRHGTGSRVYHLARELGRRHEVTVVCFDEEQGSLPAQQPFTLVALGWTKVEPGRFLRWSSRLGLLTRTAASAENVATLRELIESRRIDAVVVENLVLAHLLPVLRDQPVVWVEEGILSELRHPSLKTNRGAYRRLQDWIEYHWWRRLEAWVWSHADVLVAVSKMDAELLRKRTRETKPVVVVPNGVDFAHFADTPRVEPVAQALFVGSRWYPNVEALHFFVEKVLPRIRGQLPEFRLVVAGDLRDSRELRLQPVEGVELLGFVPDLRPHYATSRVFVAPIQRGHGTRVKILEAMAAGCPVVSTPKGAEGLDLVNGEDLLLAEGADAFAAAVVTLWNDPALAARLAKNARRRVAEKYDWSGAAALLETAASQAIRRHSQDLMGSETARASLHGKSPSE